MKNYWLDSKAQKDVVHCNYPHDDMLTLQQSATPYSNWGFPQDDENTLHQRSDGDANLDSCFGTMYISAERLNSEPLEGRHPDRVNVCCI